MPRSSFRTTRNPDSKARTSALRLMEMGRRYCLEPLNVDMNHNIRQARCFAVVCAAGRSTRMGTSKLMLPWRGRSVLAHVLESCTTSRVARSIVVVRSDDAALVEECRRWDVDVVFNDRAEADMKSSVQVALDRIDATYEPTNWDAWLLVPADAVGISANVVDRLWSTFDPTSPRIIAPVADGRPGHPLLLPWQLAIDVHQLGPQEGVRALLARYGFLELPVVGNAIHWDLDTPEDYARLLSEGNDG